jgi:hypothetical protein
MKIDNVSPSKTSDHSLSCECENCKEFKKDYVVKNQMKTKLESKIGEILDNLIDSQNDFRDTTPMGKHTQVLIALHQLLALFEAELEKEREKTLLEFLVLKKIDIKAERVKVIEEIEKWLISEEIPEIYKDMTHGEMADGFNHALTKTRIKLNELKGEGKK